MEGARYRHATSEVKRCVLAINDNIYDGWDYLADYYDYFHESPHHQHFVAEYKGCIIAYVCMYIVDNETTMVSRAVRVAEAYTGKGVYRFLMQYSKQEIKTNNAIAWEAVVITDSNSKIQSSSSPNTFWLFLTRNISHFIINPSKLDFKYPLLQACPPRKLDHKLFEKLMNNKSLCDHLFANNRFVVDWVPYRAVVSNIPILMGKNTMFCCCVPEDLETTHSFETILFSAGTAFQTRSSGFVYEIDLYGEDLKNLENHLALHLERISEEARITSLIILTDISIPLERIDLAFRYFKLKRKEWMYSMSFALDINFTEQ